LNPQEFAKLHPKLFHVTRADALPSIERHGLQSTNALLDLFEISPLLRAEIALHPRKTYLDLSHVDHGTVTLNHQKPLVESALIKCLDDGLSVPDWIDKLNSRVFFWPDDKRLNTFLQSNTKLGLPMCILSLDTLTLIQVFWDQMEVSPMNSGNTRRKPLKRGHSTFSSLNELDYAIWRRASGGRNLRTIREVIVKDKIPDAMNYVTKVHHFQ
jgi:hypothetical protein